MAEDHPEVQPTKRPPHQAARTLKLDLGLGRLDQPSVGHARGAHGLARAAIETEREMFGDRVGQGGAALGQRLDREDRAAGRVHLRAELGKCRAVRKTEAAVNALVHTLDAQPVEAQWPGRDGLVGHRVSHRAQIPATKRPGFRTLWGSRLALSRCMIRPAAPASSHTGTADFTASGAQSSLAWPPAAFASARHSWRTLAIGPGSGGAPLARAAVMTPTPAWQLHALLSPRWRAALVPCSIASDTAAGRTTSPMTAAGASKASRDADASRGHASAGSAPAAWPPNCAAMRPSSLHCHSTCSWTPSKPTTRVYRPGPSAD